MFLSKSRLFLQRNSRPHRAVTLIDLVITVLIVGILSAVAAPRFADALAVLQLEAAARQIASDLNFAKEAASQSSRVTRVSFRTSPAGYDLTGVEHPAHPGQVYTINLSDIASSVSFGTIDFNGASSIEFNAYSQPLVAGVGLVSGSVEIRSGNRTRTIAVNPSTGEATVP